MTNIANLFHHLDFLAAQYLEDAIRGTSVASSEHPCWFGNWKENSKPKVNDRNLANFGYWVNCGNLCLHAHRKTDSPRCRGCDRRGFSVGAEPPSRSAMRRWWKTTLLLIHPLPSLMRASVIAGITGKSASTFSTFLTPRATTSPITLSPS